MTTPLSQSRATDSQRRQQAVRDALRDLQARREFISVAIVARHANVHRSLIYRHPDLHAEVLAQVADAPRLPERRDAVSNASLQASLANEKARSHRLTLQVRQLEQRLSEALGRESFRDAGLDEANALQRLQDEVAELRGRHGELRAEAEDLRSELEAAQHINHQLTRQLNL